MTMDPTLPTPTTTPDTATAWHPCADDPETCPRPHWLAVGYREGVLTAVALHEPTTAGVRAPAPRERTP